MGKIIAIANQKGGVGMLNKFSKTTSVVHLGAALKLSGRKVLLVDFDPREILRHIWVLKKMEADL